MSTDRGTEGTDEQREREGGRKGHVLKGVTSGSFDLDGEDAIAFVPDDGVLRLPEDRVSATLIIHGTKREDETWRDRFERARDMDINQSRHRDPKRPVISNCRFVPAKRCGKCGGETVPPFDDGYHRIEGFCPECDVIRMKGSVALPPLIKPRHPVAAFLHRVRRFCADTWRGLTTIDGPTPLEYPDILTRTSPPESAVGDVSKNDENAGETP